MPRRIFRVQFIERGGARLIGRQAALMIGDKTAERLAKLLERLTEQEDLDKVGGWILECCARVLSA